LLNAMGVTSCFVEFIGAMLASTGFAPSFIEEAEHKGFGTDMCSYHRTILGAQMKGLMPEPKFLVATSCPCTGGLAVMENLAQQFNKALFVLHIPQEETAQNVAYFAKQIEALHGFIAQQTGVPMDMTKLSEAIVNLNKTREILLEMYDITRSVPSPVAGNDLANYAYIINLLAGTKSAVELATAFRDMFAERVKNGVGGIPTEKFRLLWIQNRVQFKNPLVKFLEEEHHTAIVIDEMNCVTWDWIDPENPYEGIARRIISNPFNGPAQRRVEHLKKLARDYHVDGAINPCNWGCRQGTGARGITASGLKSVGVPVLNLEMDCVDSRNFFEGQLKTRISAFIEMLENRKETLNG